MATIYADDYRNDFDRSARVEGGKMKIEEEQKVYKCAICDCETEYDIICKYCGENICEDCLVPFTFHNPIDFNLCTICGEESQYRASEAMHEQDELKRIKDEKREKRNAQARRRYHSIEQIEKRIIKRIERKKEQRLQEIESAKRLAKILNNIFGEGKC